MVDQLDTWSACSLADDLEQTKVGKRVASRGERLGQEPTSKHFQHHHQLLHDESHRLLKNISCEKKSWPAMYPRSNVHLHLQNDICHQYLHFP